MAEMARRLFKFPGARSTRVSPLLPVALLPMLFLLALIFVILWVSFQTGIIGTAQATYTLDNYRAVFSDPVVYGVLVNTLVFAATTTLFAIAIGLPIAWLAERTTIGGKPLIYAIMTLGLLIPGIFVAMGWTFIAHPRIGFVNRWLVDLFGLETGPINIGAPLGMGFVQGLSLAPLAFILTVQMFRAMDPLLEEAARIAGIGFAATLRRVTLPLAMPGILAAIIYIFMIGIATFDIPAVLGLGNRVYLFSTYMFIQTFPQEYVPRYGITAAVGTAMIVVALALTFWYGQVLRQGQRYQVITGKGYRPKPVDLGRWAIPCWALIGFYAFIAKVLPITMIAFVAFSPYVAAPSLDLISQLSFSNFQRINWELVGRGARNTITLMLFVPFVVLFFSFCISWFVVRSRSRARYALEFGAFLPHTLPELLFAIGALLMALFVLRDVFPLYDTVWLIALVYLVVRLAFATRAMNGSLLQVHRELEEAALVAGLSTIRTAWRVVLPIIRPTMLSVWIWTALLVYREVTVAVFLTSQNSITLPAVVWSYWNTAGMTEASMVTLFMILLLSPLLVLFWRFGRRSGLAAG
ncbi:MAG: ABC transporter permease [Candidatus Binatia bacterium]